MLAKRLARHGLAMSGGTLAAVLSQKAASAAVPASGMSSTIKGATLLAAGGGRAAGLISAKVAALTEGVLKAMLLMKLKAMAVMVVIAGMVLCGGLLTHHMLAAQQGQADKLLPEGSKGDADTHQRGVAHLLQPEKPPRQNKKIDADNHKVDAAKPDKAAAVKSVVSSPLSVTVKPQKDRIRLDEHFKVSVRVVNTSRSRQSFQVANGSWEMHWKSSNDRVHWVPRAVFRNFFETVNLDPGQAYEQTGDMLMAPGKPQKEVVFKMGFTPRGSTQTYWSNKVTVHIQGSQGA